MVIRCLPLLTWTSLTLYADICLMTAYDKIPKGANVIARTDSPDIATVVAYL